MFHLTAEILGCIVINQGLPVLKAVKCTSKITSLHGKLNEET